MVNLILFLIMILLCVITMIVLIVNVIRYLIKAIKKANCLSINRVLKKNIVFLMIIAALIGGDIFITQITVCTPKIMDSNGEVVEGSIADLQKVNLNGRNEWISIRGENKDAPIILFLAGGPGGTQMVATRHELSELEKHFVVVNWDQPGSGKSYDCINGKNITVQTYIEDGIELTKYLREKFEKDKIYLIGESWGSALGIFLINKKTEYYSGFIGTGQMVDFEETEKIDYIKAMEIAKDKGDKEFVDKLTDQGEPLYYNGNIALKSALYLNYLSSYMISNPNISNSGYNTFRDMISSEYGILDSINYMLGLLKTFNIVYPQLYETDLRVNYSKLEVPVYFFIGRHDINAPTSIVEDYYNLLEAPKKELVWFEHSGHSPWLNETDKFVKETIRVFEK